MEILRNLFKIQRIIYNQGLVSPTTFMIRKEEAKIYKVLKICNGFLYYFDNY